VEPVTRSPTTYYVLIGPFERRSQAVEAAEALRGRGFRAVIRERSPRLDEPA
jgi:cell division septation protein DedD